MYVLMEKGAQQNGKQPKGQARLDFSCEEMRSRRGGISRCALHLIPAKSHDIGGDSIVRNCS